MLLGLSDGLVRANEADERPTPEDLAEMRAGVTRRREQLQRFRQRLTGLTIEPPSKPQ